MAQGHLEEDFRRSKKSMTQCCNQCEAKAARKGVIGTPWCAKWGKCGCHGSDFSDLQEYTIAVIDLYGQKTSDAKTLDLLEQIKRHLRFFPNGGAIERRHASLSKGSME